jgi:hypothetical protein
VETQGTPTSPGRVRLEWQPNAIANRWLQIQVLATTNTGLPNREVYYVGHLQGESGLNPPAPNGLLLVQTPDLTATLPAFGAAGSITNRRDIDKNGLITTADLGLVRASVVAGRFLRLITIPTAGSDGEGVLGSGGGNGGGGGENGDGNGSGGLNDESSLVGFAMMAPLAGMGSKTDTTNAKKSIGPTATSASSLLTAGASSVNLIGAWNQQGSKLSTYPGVDEGSRKSPSTYILDVIFSDDFFSNFDDREMR